MVKSHKQHHKAETLKKKSTFWYSTDPEYRPQRGGKLPPKSFVVKGTIVKKRKTNPDTSKVRFRSPNSSQMDYPQIDSDFVFYHLILFNATY